MAEAGDVPTLTETRDRLQALGAELQAAQLAVAASCAHEAAVLLTALVSGPNSDAERVLGRVHDTIDYIGRVIDAHDAGRSVEHIPLPRLGVSTSNGSTAIDDTIDKELLASWFSGADEALCTLEALVVAIETAHESETCAEIRRCLHTFKGECGVLSLHVAQRLYHAAESAIDARIARSAALPVDGLLAMIDWTRRYIAMLIVDPRHDAPPHDDLLVMLMSAETADTKGPSVDEQRIPFASLAAPISASSFDNTPVSFDLSNLDDTVADFITEAREHLLTSEQALLALDKNPGDNESINRVFRAFHTVKGVAGFMNLVPIVSLAHSGEYLLDGARTGKIKLDPRYLDLILKACDLLGQLIGALSGGPPPTQGQLTATIQELEKASRGETPGGPLAAEIELPRAVSGTVPAQHVAEVQSAESRTSPRTGPASSVTQASEIRAGTTPASSEGASESSTADENSTIPGLAPSTNAVTKRSDQTVKVSTLRMDALVNMVGELVIAQQMVLQDPLIRDLEEQRLQRNLMIVGKIIRDLQQVSMSLRMVSLKGTFQKMSRLVRDVARKAEKRVDLHTEGEDVELDRNVVEEIADPLVHMIRNACDHGIEPADKRTAAGKPEVGNLWLRAYHSGGSIVVEIEDDGRGLDRSRIIKKAVEKGLLSADRDERDITDSEAYSLVFLPGFSTAEKVTDISGRGVGMDVVKRNIEALRGKVDISSTPGKGTVFAMRLPLTMAIIDGMVVRAGSQRYVIPTLSIERSFRPVEGDVYTVLAKGELARDRGSLLPIYRLNRVLDSAEGCQEIADGLLIVLEAHDSRCCLMVDEIIGQQQVVIKSLGENMPRITGVSGGAILGDGRVALILDVAGIVSAATTYSI